METVGTKNALRLSAGKTDKDFANIGKEKMGLGG